MSIHEEKKSNKIYGFGEKIFRLGTHACATVTRIRLQRQIRRRILVGSLIEVASLTTPISTNTSCFKTTSRNLTWL